MSSRNIYIVVILTLFLLTAVSGCSRTSGVITSEHSNGSSSNPSISPNGRYVVYESDATNLVAENTSQQCPYYDVSLPSDDNSANSISECTKIFMYDSENGLTGLVSTNSKRELANNESRGAAVSNDGRFIVFGSRANNLVPGYVSQCRNQLEEIEQNCDNIFLKDMEDGTVKLVSSNDSGEQGNGNSLNPSISADGRFITFWSGSTNLFGEDTQRCHNAYNCADVFLKDMQTGEMKLVSSNSEGQWANGDSTKPVISADGRYVAFLSEATNLASSDRDDYQDVFKKDILSGEVTLISANTEGQKGDRESGTGLEAPMISASGQYVLFTSAASNLVPSYVDRCYESPNATPSEHEEALNSCSSIFMKDILAKTTTRVSPDADDKIMGDTNESHHPSITADGRYVVFQSFHSLGREAAYEKEKAVFFKDMLTEETKLISQSDSNIVEGQSPSISAFNHFVVFEAGDGSNNTCKFCSDIFIYDFFKDETKIVSMPG